MVNIPVCNILVSVGIFFNGGLATKVLKILKTINVACNAYPTFVEHQRTYLQPAVVTFLERKQSQLIQEIAESRQKLVIGGDAMQ